MRKLTRERFEAIIVDCAGPGAAAVLRSARSAPCNKRAVAVAILDPETGLRSAFEIGAHFILYKPVSVERSKSSFRAARALMKKERRRNSRVSVHIPVEMPAANRMCNSRSTPPISAKAASLSACRGAADRLGRWTLVFTLPGSTKPLEVDAEFAWEGTGKQVGLRFQDPSLEFTRQLREWLGRNSPDAEKDDPPARCQLTDLSLGGCYLEISSPFPVSTRVTLSMRAGGVDLRTEGVVRIMHPDKGMGVEFTQSTPEHRTLLEKFLSLLTENRDMLPELLVEPEGLETESSNAPLVASADGESEDMLLGLFRSQAALTADAFLTELRKQRGLAASTGASA